MSLTVASAALDHAWAEFGAVAFTAGTLADQDACVTEVESKLKRGTLSASTTPTDTQVKNWLQRAKQELSETKKFTWRRRYVTATLTAGTFRYALPPDFDGGLTKIRDLTDDNTIKVVSSHVFDTLYPDVAEESNGKILVATVKNRELWFAPPPDGSNVIEADYSRSGDDVTATDFSWLPEIERFRCCDFAVAEAFMSLHDYERAVFFVNRWNEGLGKSIRADGKRRWSSTGYQARSVFQA